MDTFLLRANELQPRHPVVAYRLKVHYLDLAMSEYTGFDKALVGELLKELEISKATLPNTATREVAADEMRTLAQDLAERASQNDRPGASAEDKWWYDTATQVCKAHHAAAVIADALKQFGELGTDEAALLERSHQRSLALATQLKSILHQQTAVIPLDWRPTPPERLGSNGSGSAASKPSSPSAPTANADAGASTLADRDEAAHNAEAMPLRSPAPAAAPIAAVTPSHAGSPGPPGPAISPPVSSPSPVVARAAVALRDGFDDARKLGYLAECDTFTLRLFDATTLFAELKAQCLPDIQSTGSILEDALAVPCLRCDRDSATTGFFLWNCISLYLSAFDALVVSIWRSGFWLAVLWSVLAFAIAYSLHWAVLSSGRREHHFYAIAFLALYDFAQLRWWWKHPLHLLAAAKAAVGIVMFVHGWRLYHGSQERSMVVDDYPQAMFMS